ncbi:sulfurtransferase [Kaistella haifensis DSM 19056]|uniref:Sulfurtransferase n=1 Tax=Kaistella haifensis DSM 19056 TaxID=1450526 RepID=A0A246B9G1_9FLAO|nr:sulfurtransferase [Kaistella haifensis]OWK98167.1 sulfurtransferase [Kaistella haifensis DSM 19056]
MKPIIAIEEFQSIVNQGNIIVLDARSGKDAHQNYLEKHIRGARFVDLEKDLATVSSDASKGGRHPLPDLFDFAKTLSELGISENSRIVIYDDKNGANAAARCWWMLYAFGIEKVQVLDSGFQIAEKAGLEMNSGNEHFHQSTIRIPEKWQFPTSDIDEVEDLLSEKSATVIDVRDAYRYNGESEPIDPIAGHIPGAINIPLTENLTENGTFLQPEILKENYQKILNNHPEKLIIHCGSGVTACHTILAMAYAGMEIPALYVGSWSEWCRSGKEIAKN